MTAHHLPVPFFAALAGMLMACGSVMVIEPPPPDEIVDPPPPAVMNDGGAPDAPPDADGVKDADVPDTAPPVPPVDPGIYLSRGPWMLGHPACLLNAAGTVSCWHHAGAEDPWITGAAWEVPGITDAITVTDAHEQGCALHATGHVACWGWSHHGQLGLSIPIEAKSLDPIELPGVELVQLTTSHHAMCGIRPSGQAVCWGGAYEGPLGAPTPWESQAEVEVIGVSDAVDISGSPGRVCAVHATGKVACWIDHQAPVEVAGVEGAVQVSASSQCVLLASGQIMRPAVGGGMVTIPGLNDAVLVSGACARRAGGGVVCWDAMGALSTIAVNNATDLSGECAVKSDGSAVCWKPGSAPTPFPSVD